MLREHRKNITKSVGETCGHEAAPAASTEKSAPYLSSGSLDYGTLSFALCVKVNITALLRLVVIRVNIKDLRVTRGQKSVSITK